MPTTSLWDWLRQIRGRFGNSLADSDLLATALGLLILAGFFTAVVFLSFNFAVGPVGEVTGIVESATFYQNDGRTSKVIYMRLPSSDVVAVTTCTNTVLAAGQPVRLLIYRRYLTDVPSYKFAATMPPPCSAHGL